MKFDLKTVVLEGVDCSGIDLGESFGDEITQPVFALTVDDRTEIELGQCFNAVGLATGNAIKHFLKVCGEVVVNKFSEMLLKQGRYGEGIPTRDKR